MTVKSWGKGRPDFYSDVISSRPVIATVQNTQARMLTQASYEVATGAVAIVSFYTVPDGYNLALGGGYISVKDSCINKLRLVTGTEELIGDFRFDMRGDLAMSALAGQQVPENTTITAYIYNNDVISSEFSLQLSGVLTKV